jgi:hypothetical protein
LRFQVCRKRLSAYRCSDDLVTVYYEVFLPIWGTGCAIAAIVSFFAAWRSGFFVPTILLIVGVVAFWAGLFLGSEFGYQAWQSMPDPPDEAFRDTFPLGALVFGWIPGSVFCLLVFGGGWLVRQLGILLFGRRAVIHEPVGRVDSDVERPFDENPYQSPYGDD